ncbi:MAG: acireductone synthase [Aquificota bacterium]|nr:MAG: acireductone synthase [Aquificota bacterium]
MVKGIITDIEGTTSSLSYVKEVMFPYSKRRLRDFLKSNWEKPEVKSIIERLSRRLGKEVDVELAVKTFEEWIEKDLKDGLLKELQGHIWEEGFSKGELKGHVYPDAYEKLRELKERGYRLFVYSSGSVKAQKLFFGNTDYGDITGLFDGFFDTGVGQKKERESYINISKAVGLKPEELVFISDVEEELDAAKSAGLNTVLIVREGEGKSSKHRTIRSFYELRVFKNSQSLI